MRLGTQLRKPITFRRTRFPWPEWTNGRQWSIKQGVDFDCTVQGMRNTLHTQAARRDLKVRTTHVGDGELIFQFVPNGEHSDS